MAIDKHLGRKSDYANSYDKSLLVPIPRADGRSNYASSINNDNLPFKGFDIWNCYEISWLDLKGKPVSRIMTFIVPASSENIVESKSLKLYLNSFNQTKMSSQNEVEKLIKKDLKEILGVDIILNMRIPEDFKSDQLLVFKGHSLDDLDVEIEEYTINSSILSLDANNSEHKIEESLYSNLLKSNCLVTNQPDFASIRIDYKGSPINHESLLKYIISFRNHNEFHEQCVERMFFDITKHCEPEYLTIHAKFTRRGGIDINPIRSNLGDFTITDIDQSRDPRQ